MYHQLLTIKNSVFCSQLYLCVFAWISEQAVINSLYNINWLVFITEAECLLRGTNWVFKSDKYSFVLKSLASRLLSYGPCFLFALHYIVMMHTSRSARITQICFPYMIRDHVTLTIQNCLFRWGWFYTFHIKDYCGLGIFLLTAVEPRQYLMLYNTADATSVIWFISEIFNVLAAYFTYGPLTVLKVHSDLFLNNHSTLVFILKSDVFFCVCEMETKFLCSP